MSKAPTQPTDGALEAQVYSKDYWDLVFEQLSKRTLFKIGLVVLAFLYGSARVTAGRGPRPGRRAPAGDTACQNCERTTNPKTEPRPWPMAMAKAIAMANRQWPMANDHGQGPWAVP